MADYEVERERIVEREVPTTRIVEREVPTTRRTLVERRSTGGGFGYGPGGFNAVQGLIAAAVAIILLLLILGAFTR